MSKFKTRAGRLTRYALACGYVERKEWDDMSVTLWHEGGPTYHVRAHDYRHGKRLFWLCYDTLTEARRAYDQCRMITISESRTVMQPWRRWEGERVRVL